VAKRQGNKKNKKSKAPETHQEYYDDPKASKKLIRGSKQNHPYLEDDGIPYSKSPNLNFSKDTKNPEYYKYSDYRINERNLRDMGKFIHHPLPKLIIIGPNHLMDEQYKMMMNKQPQPQEIRKKHFCLQPINPL
jgi:hypothetical protein